MYADEPDIRFNEVEFDIESVIFALRFQYVNIHIQKMMPAFLITIPPAILDDFDHF